MLYIKHCFTSALSTIIFWIILLIFSLIKHNKNKLKTSEKMGLILAFGIFIVPSSFSDLKFCYEYYKNPEIKATIEIEKITRERIKPHSMIGFTNMKPNYQLLYTTEHEAYLLKDDLDLDTTMLINYKEIFSTIKDLKDEGILSDISNDYIEKISTTSKFNIKYIKTNRYNIITSIEKVEK